MRTVRPALIIWGKSSKQGLNAQATNVIQMQVKTTPQFVKSLDRLDTPVKRRILEKARELADDPHEGKMLRGELGGLFSLRVGDYRVIYWIDYKENTVWLVDVGHRKKIYRRP